MKSKKEDPILESQFYKDLSTPLLINGKKSSKGWYNLIVSIRDLRLYNCGIKPYRNWRYKDVKNYFGITGNSNKALDILEHFKDVLMTEV
jgi:hypothetical protein